MKHDETPDGGGLVPLWKDGNDDIEEEEDES